MSGQSIRQDVANFLVSLPKGATFTTEDVYKAATYGSSEHKTARNHLAEFAAAGLVKRVSRGTYKVTTNAQTRRSRLS